MDVTEEKLRLDVLHSEQLLRIAKTQEQERNHIAQIQAQERRHHQQMLDIQHRANYNASLALQRAYNKEEFEHHKRMLGLAHQHPTSEKAKQTEDPTPGSEENQYRDEDTVGFEEPLVNENAGPAGVGIGGFGNKMSKGRESRAEIFSGFARAAAKRDEEKKKRG
ncbi:hypothetical protein BDR22DRAFT_891669 [Usnea florida]